MKNKSLVFSARIAGKINFQIKSGDTSAVAEGVLGDVLVHNGNVVLFGFFLTDSTQKTSIPNYDLKGWKNRVNDDFLRLDYISNLLDVLVFLTCEQLE